MHPLRQSNFARIQSPRATDGLSPCQALPHAPQSRSRPNSNSSSARLASTRATIRPAAFRRVNAFASGTQNDATLTKLAERAHHLRSVAAQAIKADNDDGVAFARIVQERSKLRTLLPVDINARSNRYQINRNGGRLKYPDPQVCPSY
jgi:hypothetical protein